MANKISVILDVATEKAVGSVKGFKQSIDNADGAIGKMKAGATSAFDTISTAGVGMAAAAGTAIVAFGVKSVTAFTDTAIAAGTFAEATGLSTTEASKWVAVGDDIGISADAMETSFGKLAVQLGKNNPLLEQYGIHVVNGENGQADMNATMLNAIDVIKNIKDPTEKAAVAQAALGKGWMDMAELIDQGSDSLTTSMSEVSEAQIIDAEEVEKARKMRESMDNLHDAVGDLALTLGEDLVPMAIAGAEALTKMIGPLQDVNQWSKNAATSFYQWIGIIDDAPTVADDAASGVGRMGTALDSTTDAVKKATTVTDLMKAAVADELAVTVQVPAAVDALKDAINDQKDAEKEAEQAARDHTKALEDQRDATDDLFSSKQMLVGGDIAVRESQRQAAEAVGALNELTKDGKTDTDEFAVAQDGAASSLLAAAQAAADYQIDQAEANGETLSGESKTNLYKLKLQELADTLAPGSPLRAMIDGYIADLQAIPSEVKTSFTISARGATVTPTGDFIGIGGARASGGPVSAGVPYLVGERGMELFTPAMNGYITPHSAIAGGWGGAASSLSGAPSVSVVVEGNIYGDKHLRSQLDQWARNVQREIAGAA